MNAPRNDPQSLRGRWIWVAMLAALVITVAAWLAPSRTKTVVSLEGPERWQLTRAPLRRKIVWESAEKIEAPFSNLEARASLIRPQLDENGTALYFTLRKADGTSDIYRARLVRGEWRPAEPVAELNSTSDDVGPVISRDGKTLYLYSDRGGGQGGFDLYACERREKRWSAPRNLGPRINSPAHEFDPAISPDGARLFFASNRSPQMQERLQKGAGEGAKPWRTTLRADLGLAKFDLYEASRDAADEDWLAARRLEKVNRPESNEGAPYVSSSGAFLYFNSDRPARRGEAVNFDLYRARIQGDGVDLTENLGAGINTEANELEPALSPEGFRLYFSRSRGESGKASESLQYDLYASQAAEVEEVAAWDNSRLSALVGNLWWLSMLALLVALLVSVVWYSRRVSFRRLSVSSFLLAAILIHLLMGTGTFFVYFGDDIVQQVKRDIGEVIMATDISFFDSSRPEQEQQPDYEKAADLTSPETVKTQEPPRQIVENPNVPVPTRTEVPQLTATARSETPPLERPLPAVPAATTPTPATPPLMRRNLAQPVAAEPIELSATQAAPPAAEEMPKSAQVVVAPRATTEPKVAPREMPVKTVVSAPSPDAPPVSRSQASPAVTPQAAPSVALVRASAARPTLADAPQVVAEPVAPVGAPTPDTAVERADVALTRKDVTPLATVPVGAPKRVIDSQAAAGPTALDGAARVEAKPMAPASTTPASLPVMRAATRPVDKASSDAVALVSPEPSATPKPPADAPATGSGVEVTVAKVESGPTLSPLKTMPAVTSGSAASRPEASQVSQVQSNVVPTPSPTRPDASLPRDLVRRGPATKEIATAGNIALEGVAGPESSLAPMSDKVAATDVNIVRRETIPLVGPTSKQPTIGGPHRSESMPLALGSVERQNVLTPLSASPVESRIARLPSRSFAQKYAEDAIRLQGLLRLRQADGDTKRDLLARSGADDRTLATITSGLNWMQQHQHADGHWSLEGFHTECGRHGGKPCTGLGSVKSDAAATGFALLPFLGDGHTHRAGKHQAIVAKGIKWLVDHQKQDGELYTDNPASTARMYSHGIATIALCEAYAMSRDEALKEPAQRAIRFIVNSQNKTSGGWRYQPGVDADTSVVGWQVMALKSGQMAELDVPQETLELTRKFLGSVAGQGPIFGQYGYQPNVRFTPAMTAEALLCLEYLGVQRTEPALQAGAQHLLANLPQRGKETSYYWYYGTQSMYHMQGETWKKWSTALHPMLIDSQIRTGEMAGSWLPEDARELPGGTIMSTSLRVLMLEVNYRHLPLYQVLDQAAVK